MNTARARELLDVIDKAQTELAELFNGPTIQISGSPIEIKPILPGRGNYDKKKVLRDLETMKPKAVAQKHGIDVQEVYNIKHSSKKEKISDHSNNKGGAWSAKPCCGSTGSRHFKTCVNYNTTARKPYVQKPFAEPELTQDAGQTKARPLSTEEWNELRDAMKDPKFQSIIYASSQKLSLREVNKAIRSSTYQDYIDEL